MFVRIIGRKVLRKHKKGTDQPSLILENSFHQIQPLVVNSCW